MSTILLTTFPARDGTILFCLVGKLVVYILERVCGVPLSSVQMRTIVVLSTREMIDRRLLILRLSLVSFEGFVVCLKGILCKKESVGGFLVACRILGIEGRSILFLSEEYHSVEASGESMRRRRSFRRLTSFCGESLISQLR